ncbi:MAG: hypothetical protein QOH71_1339 [Blastocatellia bacterium]|jgi:hypothetical protein|nr:hypothetical protein [Blastocatellia bacterium]
MKNSIGAKDEVSNGDQDVAVSNDEQFQNAASSPSNEAQRSEGSVGYRIAAMVAMFLLALAGILFWYFGH